MRKADFKFDICGRPRWGFKTVHLEPKGTDAVDVTLPGARPVTLQRKGASEFVYGELPKTGSGQRIVLQVPQSNALGAQMRLRIESGNEELFNRWTGTAKL